MEDKDPDELVKKAKICKLNGNGVLILRRETYFLPPAPCAGWIP